MNADGMISTGQGILGYNMFVYCGNNSVNRIDTTGQSWVAALIVTVVAAVANIGGHHITKRNHRQNFKKDSDETTTTSNRLISDQNGATGKNYRYGLFNASYNACEIIAVHNAKVLLGEDSSLSQTTESFYKSGAMWLFGTFGSYPSRIGTVLKVEGIEYCDVASPADMTLYGTYIMSFWTKSHTIHTVAFSHTNQGYTVYNLYGDGFEYDFNPMEYSDQYICGYYMW